MDIITNQDILSAPADYFVGTCFPGELYNSEDLVPLPLIYLDTNLDTALWQTFYTLHVIKRRGFTSIASLIRNSAVRHMDLSDRSLVAPRIPFYNQSFWGPLRMPLKLKPGWSVDPMYLTDDTQHIDIDVARADIDFFREALTFTPPPGCQFYSAHSFLAEREDPALLRRNLEILKTGESPYSRLAALLAP